MSGDEFRVDQRFEADWLPDGPPVLTIAQQRALLDLAHAAIAAHVGELAAPHSLADDPALQRRAGVFVTLRTLPAYAARFETAMAFDDLPLRGCVGHVPADLPLLEAVRQAAVNAASADPRFPPLRREDIGTIRLKVAILSPLRLVQDLEELDVDRHGLLICGARGRGLLLPGVAPRFNWTLTEYLENLCYKAGLPADCWPDHAELYRFVTAEFGADTGFP